MSDEQRMSAGGEVAGEVIGVGSAEAVGLAHQRAIDPEGSSPHAALERERHLLALPAGGHLSLAENEHPSWFTQTSFVRPVVVYSLVYSYLCIFL